MGIMDRHSYSEGQADGRLILMKLALAGMLNPNNFPKIREIAEATLNHEPNDYGRGYHDVVISYVEEFGHV